MKQTIITLGVLLCLVDLSYGVFKNKIIRSTTPEPKNPMDDALLESYDKCKDLEGNQPDTEDTLNLKKKGSIPKSKGGMCLTTCMMQQAGMVDEHGQFSVVGCQKLVQKYAPHLVGQASDYFIKDCDQIIGKVDGKCEVAPRIVSCFSFLKVMEIYLKIS